MTKKTSLAIKTSLIIITAVASQISIGFSAWYRTNTNTAELDGINVNVGITHELDSSLIYENYSCFKTGVYFFEIEDPTNGLISSATGELKFNFSLIPSEIKKLYSYTSETSYSFTLVGNLAVVNKTTLANASAALGVFASSDGCFNEATWTPAYGSSSGVTDVSYNSTNVDFVIKTTVSASAGSVDATLTIEFNHKLVYGYNDLFKDNCFLLTIKKGAKI